MFDLPTITKSGTLGGSGPRILLHTKHERSATHTEADRDHTAIDQSIAESVGRMLHHHYRGHFWMVHVDSKQGVCLITIPVLLGNWKYKIPLTSLSEAMVVRAGGEILERFKIPRGNIDIAAFVSARGKAVSRANEQPPG